MMPNVRLKTVQYAERVGKPKEWTLEGLTLWPINLLVGKNATGKSRSLNILWSLAQMFHPEPRFRSRNCGYDLLFDSDGSPLRYLVQVDDGRVLREEVHAGQGVQLIRRPNGDGSIYTATEGRMIPFKPPENDLAAVSRRDSLQHPFLEPLHEWALGVRHYTFGTQLGKNHIVIAARGTPEPDDRNPDQVVAIFRKGVKEIGPRFTEAILQDMAHMGYALTEVGTYPPQNIVLLQSGGPTEVLGIGVREKGIEGIVDQNDMSQGMFRALSIIIQVNYAQLTHRASCILIDDIGEGLDFERSVRLIEILRKKAQESFCQLVMTTNDHFIMNHVPLKEWSVLQREGCHVRVRNHENAREAFEYFRFVGMSNFAFFEMDFVNGAPAEEGVTAHE
jgi:hypothetical protein